MGFCGTGSCPLTATWNAGGRDTLTVYTWNKLMTSSIFMYEIYGILLRSVIDFPELGFSKKDSGISDFSFDLTFQESQAQIGLDCEYLPLPKEKFSFELAKCSKNYLIRFPEIADFHLLNKTKICCHALLGIPNKTIRHLLLDQVIPVAISNTGKIALHASSVVIADKAAVFIGDSGHGKSTLVAKFGQQGFPILTDDCLVLNFDQQHNSLTGMPGYPSLRLWPDTASDLVENHHSLPTMAHYSEKKRFDLNKWRFQFYSKPAPVGHIFILNAPANCESNTKRVSFQQLSAIESLIELAKHQYSIGIIDRENLGRVMRMLSRIVKYLPPIHRISYPRNFSVAPLIIDEILARVQNTQARSV